jgi:CheY-like chemotaxis protein
MSAPGRSQALIPEPFKGEGTPVSDRQLRVLYVDDDRINTLLFAETCRGDRRLQVLTAANPDDALDIAREARPEVLVVDLHMPDADGLQLLADLRRIEGLDRAPAFLCTAERLEEVQQRAAEAGLAGVWIKPVQLATVQRDLERLALLG